MNYCLTILENRTRAQGTFHRSKIGATYICLNYPKKRKPVNG